MKKLGVVAHTFNPREDRRISEFKANLVNMACLTTKPYQGLTSPMGICILKGVASFLYQEMCETEGGIPDEGRF